MRLRTKFAVVLVVIALILSAGVYGGLEIYKQRIVGDTQQSIDETANRAAGQIEAGLQERKDYVGFVASRPRAAQFNESNDFLREFVDNSRFFAAQVIAANGTIIDFHGDVTQEVRQDSVGRNVGNRTYVSAALSGEVYMTEPEYTNATNKYLVVIAAPIFDDREITGVLATAIYLDSQTVFSMLGPLETSSRAVTVQIDDKTLYSPHRTFPEEIRGEATIPMPATGTEWTVTVIQDRRPLLVQLQDLAIAQGVGLFIVLLSVVVFGVWEYRTTLNQTETLLEGFTALEAGDFDYRLSLAAAEEWEQISDGFNDLAQELAARDQAIQQREQRIEVLNRALRHNLRNLTSVVLGYAETIRDETTQERVDTAASHVIDTALRLIDLSDKARQIESAMDSATYGEVMAIDVSELIRTVLTDIRREYPDVQIAATLPDSTWVEATPAIELALANLFENACEHNTHPDPRLEVTVTTPDASPESILISIADNGPGIPDQDRAVITEGQETAVEHGSGLGLWLVYWAVDQSDGELHFRDNKPGTIVDIELNRLSEPDSSSE